MSAQAQEPISVFTWLWRGFMSLLPGILIALIALDLSPAVDLPLSRLFYHPGEGFFLDQSWPAQLLYHGTVWLSATLALGLLGVLAWASLAGAPRKALRNAAAYAVLALAIGPGLVANTLLKDHWGRPRPEQVRQFGGSSDFVPALWPTGSCGHNCSFVSGHAAAGFFLMTGAWIWPRRRWWWLGAGAAAGTLIGLGRIVQGGHFFRDVLGAGIVVYLTDDWLYRWMLARGWLPPPPPPAKKAPPKKA
jgi:lipid A 4'-phosphatase